MYLRPCGHGALRSQLVVCHSWGYLIDMWGFSKLGVSLESFRGVLWRIHTIIEGYIGFRAWDSYVGFLKLRGPFRGFYGGYLPL